MTWGRDVHGGSSSPPSVRRAWRWRAVTPIAARERQGRQVVQRWSAASLGTPSSLLRRAVVTIAMVGQRRRLRLPGVLAVHARRIVGSAVEDAGQAPITDGRMPLFPGGRPWTGTPDQVLRSPASAAVVAPRPHAALGSCLIVTGSLDVGGMDEVVTMLANRLPEQGWRTAVLHTDVASNHAHRLAEDLRRRGVEVFSARQGVDLASVMKDRPRVVSAHGAPRWVLESAHRAGIPVVETLHGVHDFLGADQEEEASRSALLTHVIAVSELVRDHYLAVNPGLPRAGLSVVPNGVDDQRRPSIDRSWARTLLGLEDEFLFVSLGRYCLQKNTYALVDAFMESARRRADTHLLVAGRVDDPLYAQQVQRLVERGSFRSRVHLRGHHPDPAVLLAAADAFVLDSFFEGWSLASMEALCAGAPVVLSDVGGAREQIRAAAGGGRLVANPLPPTTPLSWRTMGAAAYSQQANREELVEAMDAIAEGGRWTPDRRAMLAASSAECFSPVRTLAEHARILAQAAGGQRTTVDVQGGASVS